MQRFSVSLDDELAEWVEAQAESRGVSKAKVIRDAVAIGKETGLTLGQPAGDEQAKPVPARLQNIEARLTALEQYPLPTQAQSGDEEAQDRAGILALFRDVVEDHPPQTSYGKAAVVDVFSLLLEEGPLKTADIRETVYTQHDSEFTDSRAMWQSIQRHFDQIPGIEKVDYAKWDADPAVVIESIPQSKR